MHLAHLLMWADDGTFPHYLPCAQQLASSASVSPVQAPKERMWSGASSFHSRSPRSSIPGLPRSGSLDSGALLWCNWPSKSHQVVLQKACHCQHSPGIMVKCADRKKNIDLPRMELLELNLLPSICFVRFLIHPHRLVPCSECLMLDCAEGKVFFPRVWFLRKQLTVLNVHLF